MHGNALGNSSSPDLPILTAVQSSLAREHTPEIAILQNRRIAFIDTSRGMAMILVCLSHFMVVYERINNVNLGMLFHGTLIASPLFMIISGIMLGYFYSSRRNSFIEIKRKYITRGLFLITFGHIIISLANIHICNGFINAMKSEQMTDTIGICIIIAPILITTISRSWRVVISCFLFGSAWLFAALWMPQAISLKVIKEALFGTFDSPRQLIYSFPIVPWFSLYFMSSCLGEKLNDIITKAKSSAIHRYFYRIAIASCCCGIAIKAGIKLLVYYKIVPSSHPALSSLVNQFQKDPPSLLYILVYGGLGLFLISIVFVIQAAKRSPITEQITEFLGVVGRNSLFVFLLQFFIYYVFFISIPMHSFVSFIIYFGASIAVIVLAANLWERMRFDPYLNVNPRQMLKKTLVFSRFL